MTLWIALAVAAVLIALIAITAAGASGERSRTEDVSPIETRRLSAEERDRFLDDWRWIETLFVERPALAVIEADELTSDIMAARGYPSAEFDRKRHAALQSRGRGQISTEGLRQAMLHYNALFDELVNAGFDVEQEIPQTREVTPKPIIRNPAPDEYPPREESRK